MKKIPEFKNEDAERNFWAKNSPLYYFDTAKARRVDLQQEQPGQAVANGDEPIKPRVLHPRKSKAI